MIQFHFEWDPQKARVNYQKHKIRFEESATVFKDSNMLTLFDEKHSKYETRWLTMGLSSNGKLLVVNHTYDEISRKKVVVRIISSRKTTKNEIVQYKGE